jgi:hypothetical protein
MRKQSMMGSPKFELEPELFEKAVEDKLKVNDRFKADLREVLNRDYRYQDNSRMSAKAKRELLIEIHKEFIGGID